MSGKDSGGIGALVVGLILMVVNLIIAIVDLVFPPAKVKCPVDHTNQSTVDAATGIRRSKLNDGRLLVTIDESVTTLYDNFRRGAKMAGDNPCLGTREGGVGKYVWQSYNDVIQRYTNFGSGLVELGVAPGQHTFIGLYSINRADWVVAEQACNAYSMITVPLYDTLGLEAVKYILGQASISVVVVEEPKMPLLLKAKALFDSDLKAGYDSTNEEKKVAAKACPLKIVIKMGDSIKESEKADFEKLGLKLFSMAEVEKLGAAKRSEHVPPKPDDIATICYTSGTTGNPKGAMLLHRNLIADVSAAQLIFQNVAGMEKLTNDDSLISFLPLAHMFERIMQTYIYFHGARVGFYTGDPRQITNDMAVLQPTIFPCVPRLLNRVHALVMRDVEKASPVKRALFKNALKYKHAELANGVVRKTSFWDMLVFKKIQAKLGGRVKMMITGAAPISAEVLTDLRAMLGCSIFEGYGQTEGTAGSCITLPGDHKAGHVGPPLPCNEIRLADVEDMGLVAARDNRGEICYRGPNIFIGYLHDQARTAEALDSDGWLHSGDIGTWLPQGTLKLVDRKKSIFKLAQGEYVAPEKIENVYTQDTRIAQAFVYGDSHQASLVAIFVVDPATFTEWANKKGYKGDCAALVSDSEITKVLLDEVNTMARTKLGLQAFECAKVARLTDDAFTVENGLLTPTFKTKRPQITAKYKENVIKELIAATHRLEEIEKQNIKG